MKIDIHILTSSAGIISDTAGVKSPEGEYSPPIIAFSNLLQSTIDSNTPNEKNLNTKNSISKENSTSTLYVAESQPSDTIVIPPSTNRTQQSENVLETVLQAETIIGFGRKQFPVSVSQNQIKFYQPFDNIQNNTITTPKILLDSTVENIKKNSANGSDELQHNNSEHTVNPLKATGNFTQKKVTGTATAKEKFVEVESMVRDFRDSMNVQTKSKVHINLLPSHIDDVQVRVDISNTANDEIPDIMDMIIQNLWIPMQQKNQLSGINNTEDAVTVQYDNSDSETNFDQILHSEYQNTSYDNIHIKNQTQQKDNPSNLKKNVHFESSKHNMYHQVATGNDADSTVDSLNRSKQDSSIHEYKQGISEHSPQLHNGTAENQKSVSTQKQKLSSYDRLNDTSDSEQVSYKNINNTQNDDAITNNESSFKKKPSKIEKDNSPKEFVLPKLEKNTNSVKIENISSSNRILSSSKLPVNSDTHNHALQAYIQKLFPETNSDSVITPNTENQHISENIEPLSEAIKTSNPDNPRKSFVKLDDSMTIVNGAPEGKKQVTEENPPKADVKIRTSLDTMNEINSKKFQDDELYTESEYVPEMYVHEDSVKTISKKSLNDTNNIVSTHKPQDSINNSLDVNRTISESDITQTRDEKKSILNETLQPDSKKTPINSQDKENRSVVNQTEYDNIEEGSHFALKNTTSSNGKEHPSYSKDSIPLNYRKDSITNHTSQQDIEIENIEKTGLPELKNLDEQLRPNMSNDKTVDKRNKQEYIHTVKQSVTNSPINENEGVSVNSDSKVSAQLNNNHGNEILGIDTKKVVQNKLVHINSDESQKINTIIDAKNSDREYVSRDNSGLEENTIIPKKSSANTIINDEPFKKTDDSSVKVDDYTVKVKETASGNTSIGLVNKVQNRVSQEVPLAIESEENPIIRGAHQKTTAKDVTEPSNNPFISKRLSENRIQNSESVESTDNPSIIVQNQGKIAEPTSAKNSVRVTDKEQNRVSQEVSLAIESEEIPNQGKIAEPTSAINSVRVTDKEQNRVSQEVSLAIESEEIPIIRGEQQRTTLKKLADQSDNPVETQRSNVHLNQNEKLTKVTQDTSANINVREAVKSGNTILQKSIPLSENSQVQENIDVYQINNETIKNRTSHSQLMNSSSVKEVSNVDSTAQTKFLTKALIVHEENEVTPKVEQPTTNYKQSGEILKSESKTELPGKKESASAKPLSGEVKNDTNDIKLAANTNISKAQLIHIENSVEESDDISIDYTSLSSNEKKSVKVERSEVLNTEKTLHKSHNVSPQMQETKYVKLQSDNTSVRNKKDETQKPVNQNEKTHYEPKKFENDSTIDYKKSPEIDSEIHISDDKKNKFADNNLPLYKDSDKNNASIAAKTISDSGAAVNIESDKTFSMSLKTSDLHNGQKNNLISQSTQGIAENKGIVEENIAYRAVSLHSSLPAVAVDELQESEPKLFYNIFYGDKNEEVIPKTIATELQKPEKLVRDNEVNTHPSSLKSTSHDKVMVKQNTENTNNTTLPPIDKAVSDSVSTLKSTKIFQETLQNNANNNVDSNAKTRNEVTTNTTLPPIDKAVSDSVSTLKSTKIFQETLQNNANNNVDSNAKTRNKVTSESNKLNQQNLHSPKSTSLNNKIAPTMNRVDSENIQTEISNKGSISVNSYNNVSDETSISSKHNKINTENTHNKAHNAPHPVTSTLYRNDNEEIIVENPDLSENVEKHEESAEYVNTELGRDNYSNVLISERNLHPPLQTSDGTVYVLKNKNLDNAAIVITPPSEFQSLGQAVPNTAMALHSIIEKASSVGVPVKNIVFKIRYNDAVSSENTGVVSNANNKKDVNQGVHIPKINTLNYDGIAYQSKTTVSAKSVDNQEIMGIMKKGIALNHIHDGVEKKADKKVAVSGEQNSNGMVLEGTIKKSEDTSQQNSTNQDNNLWKKESLPYRTSLKNASSNDNVEKSAPFSDIIAPALSERGNTVQRENPHVIRSNNDAPINNSVRTSKQDIVDAETELQTSLSQNSGQSLGISDNFAHSVIIENSNLTSREGIVIPQSIHIQSSLKNGLASPKKDTSMEVMEPLPVHHFAEKAHEYISSKAQGNGTVRMVLQPEELGTVIVRYSTQSSDAQLHIQVDSQQTKQIIESQLPQLKDQFGKQGMHLDNVEVSVRKKEEEMSNSSQYSQNRQGQSQQEQESRQQFTRSFKYAADARKAQMTVNYNTSAFNRIFQSQR